MMPHLALLTRTTHDHVWFALGHAIKGEEGTMRSHALATIGVVAALVVGCASAPPSTAPSSSAVSQGAVDSTGTPGSATGTASAQTSTGDIPPGRGIAEGGGGPMSYTFREEWRRARAEVQKWRSGAYLISGSGQYVNDDGVPNSWSLRFIDKADADAVLLVDIDPWGKVTQTRQITGSGVVSFVGQYTQRMPYDIIDSDKAVELGKAALAAKYNLAKTKEPSLGINFSELDGSGPYWNYMLFYESTAEYVTAQVNALTGAVTPVS
jgi:hypothetical protein